MEEILESDEFSMLACSKTEEACSKQIELRESLRFGASPEKMMHSLHPWQFGIMYLLHPTSALFLETPLPADRKSVV